MINLSNSCEQQGDGILQIFRFPQQIQSEGYQIFSALRIFLFNSIDNVFFRIEIGQHNSKLIGGVEIAGGVSTAALFDIIQRTFCASVEAAVVIDDFGGTHTDTDADPALSAR